MTDKNLGWKLGIVQIHISTCVHNEYGRLLAGIEGGPSLSPVQKIQELSVGDLRNGAL